MATFKTKFAPRDKVIIDGGDDMVATVTSVQIFAGGDPQYKIEWIFEGTPVDAEIDEFRLSAAP